MTAGAKVRQKCMGNLTGPKVTGADNLMVG
jgi:hypothetical protein